MHDLNRLALNLKLTQDGATGDTRYSSDQLVNEHGADLLGIEASSDFLGQMQLQGMPPHALDLHEGMIYTVLRNIDQQAGIVNGQLVELVHAGRRLVVVRKLGDPEDCVHTLPRIIFEGEIPRMKAKLQRKQFPLQLAYAMTYNKSQGKTLGRVVVDLRKPPFAHGMLYVVTSRVCDRMDILLLVNPDQVVDGHVVTPNIVIKELIA